MKESQFIKHPNGKYYAAFSQLRPAGTIYDLPWHFEMKRTYPNSPELRFIYQSQTLDENGELVDIVFRAMQHSGQHYTVVECHIQNI